MTPSSSEHPFLDGLSQFVQARHKADLTLLFAWMGTVFYAGLLAVIGLLLDDPAAQAGAGFFAVFPVVFGAQPALSTLWQPSLELSRFRAAAVLSWFIGLVLLILALEVNGGSLNWLFFEAAGATVSFVYPMLAIVAFAMSLFLTTLREVIETFYERDLGDAEGVDGVGKGRSHLGHARRVAELLAVPILLGSLLLLASEDVLGVAESDVAIFYHPYFLSIHLILTAAILGLLEAAGLELRGWQRFLPFAFLVLSALSWGQHLFLMGISERSIAFFGLMSVLSLWPILAIAIHSLRTVRAGGVHLVGAALLLSLGNTMNGVPGLRFHLLSDFWMTEGLLLVVAALAMLAFRRLGRIVQKQSEQPFASALPAVLGAAALVAPFAVDSPLLVVIRAIGVALLFVPAVLSWMPRTH